MKLLLERIYPQIKPGGPICGCAWSAAIRRNALRKTRPTTPGVELHANVPDVRPFLAECGVLVVPLRIGGGSRLKILEALASGMPVVSTRIGAEGLSLEPGAI